MFDLIKVETCLVQMIAMENSVAYILNNLGLGMVLVASCSAGISGIWSTLSETAGEVVFSSPLPGVVAGEVSSIP